MPPISTRKERGALWLAATLVRTALDDQGPVDVALGLMSEDELRDTVDQLVALMAYLLEDCSTDDPRPLLEAFAAEALGGGR